MAALFTAQESFRQQFNSFTVDLFYVGFSVQGTRLRYVTGFQSTVPCTSYPAPGGGAPAESTSVNYTWSDGSVVNTSSASWALGTQTKPTAVGLTACSSAAYIAVSYGTPASSVVDPGPTAGDIWSINQSKLLRNNQVYLGL